MPSGDSEGPEVSVIIPTRDRRPMLSTALSCALGQEEVELEVIVVDDGSRDDTPSHLGELDDARLRIFRHQTPQGVSRARNRGIAEARASWVAFLDDDDLWSPRKLREQLDAAALESASFVYASGVVVDERMRLLRTVPAANPRRLLERIVPWNFIGGPSTMVARTDLVRRLGGFDERLAVLADWDLWIRLAQTGRPAACDEVLVAYLKHQGNMQVTYSAHLSAEFEHLAEKHRSLREQRRLDFDYVVFWRWVAIERLRAGRRLEAAWIFLRGAVAYRSVGNLIRAAGTVFGEPAIEGARAILMPNSLPRPAWLPPIRPARARSSLVR